MAPRKKETGLRELTVKLQVSSSYTTEMLIKLFREYAIEPRDPVDKETFKTIVNSAYIYVLGQTAPEYTIENFDIRTRKGSIIMEAKDLNKLWAALSIYGNHFGQKIAFHYFSIKEE